MASVAKPSGTARSPFTGTMPEKSWILRTGILVLVFVCLRRFLERDHRRRRRWRQFAARIGSPHAPQMVLRTGHHSPPAMIVTRPRLVIACARLMLGARTRITEP